MFPFEIEAYYKQKTGTALVQHVNFKWSDLGTQIEHLVRWFSQTDVDWNDIINMVLGDAQQTQDQMAVFIKE